MDRAKKRLVSALDGFRNQHKSEIEMDEKINSEDVCLTRVSNKFSYLCHSRTLSKLVLCQIWYHEAAKARNPNLPKIEKFCLLFGILYHSLRTLS